MKLIEISISEAFFFAVCPEKGRAGGGGGVSLECCVIIRKNAPLLVWCIVCEKWIYLEANKEKKRLRSKEKAEEAEMVYASGEREEKSFLPVDTQTVAERIKRCETERVDRAESWLGIYSSVAWVNTLFSPEELEIHLNEDWSTAVFLWKSTTLKINGE